METNSEFTRDGPSSDEDHCYLVMRITATEHKRNLGAGFFLLLHIFFLTVMDDVLYSIPGSEIDTCVHHLGKSGGGISGGCDEEIDAL